MSADRIAELRRLIEEANRDYYENDSPRMSDAEYDKLMRELQALEKGLDAAAIASSPTQKVGGRASANFPPFTHPTPLYSLNNAFDEGEVRDFINRIIKQQAAAGGDETLEYTAELKLDGIALNLVYENGRLATAATRGDGVVGETITTQVQEIKSIPQTLHDCSHAPSLLEVRGEVIMSTEQFLQLNEQQRSRGKKEFANPRNAAGGHLRRLHASESEGEVRRWLSFYAHGIGKIQMPSQSQPTNLDEMMTRLQGYGFTLAEPRIKTTRASELLSFHKQIQDTRAQLPFSVDGIVYKVNAFAVQQTLGHTAKAPRFAIAHKFAAETAITQLKAIDIQVSRLGVLTPVARLQPVAVGGVMVTNATLHNADFIAEKDLRVGDTVEIRRAGDVIPEVIRLLKDKRDDSSEAWQPPTQCPECASNVYKDNVFYYCDNRHCPARQRAGLMHFVSRGALAIDGVGGGVLEKMFDAGFVKTPADLFVVQREQLLQLELIADLAADNILTAIAAAKNTTLARLIYALGIPLVGANVAQFLSEVFGSLKRLQNAPRAVFAFLPNIGIEMAQSLHDYFNDSENQALINRLAEVGVQYESSKAPAAPRPLAEYVKALPQLARYDNTMPDFPKGLGKNGSAALVAAFGNHHDIETAPAPALAQALGKPPLAHDIYHYFASEGYHQLAAYLNELGMTWTTEQAADTRPLAGKTFVLTGTLPTLSRKEATELIVAAGGKVVGKVTKSTDYVIAGENAGSKQTEAARLNIPLWSEPQLRTATES